MNIKSLKGESEEKKMTTSKGLSVTISKQTHSVKSGCLTDEADVTRMPNVNTNVRSSVRSRSLFFLELQISLVINLNHILKRGLNTYRQGLGGQHLLIPSPAGKRLTPRAYAWWPLMKNVSNLGPTGFRKIKYLFKKNFFLFPDKNKRYVV